MSLDWLGDNGVGIGRGFGGLDFTMIQIDYTRGMLGGRAGRRVGRKLGRRAKRGVGSHDWVIEYPRRQKRSVSASRSASCNVTGLVRGQRDFSLPKDIRDKRDVYGH